MACAHIYLRGEIYWFRRRVPKQRDAVAFSLSTRDPAVARAMGRQLNADWDLIVTTGLSSQDIAHALRGALLRREIQDGNRFRADIKFSRAQDEAGRRELMAERRSSARIFAALNELAAEHGAGCRYSSAIASVYEARGYSAYELGIIEDKIHKGYIRSMFRFDDPIAATPSRDAVEQELRQVGATLNGAGGDNAVLAAFAQARARQERRAEDLYNEAWGDPLSALRRAAPPLSDLTSARDPSPPPYASADAFQRGDFDVVLASDQAPAALDGAPAQAQASTSTSRPDAARTAPVPPPGGIVAPVDAHLGSEAPGITTVATLNDLVEALKQSKAAEWTLKTYEQHVRVVELLQKVVGSNDIAALTQAHVGAFRGVLSALPHNHGKSPKDKFRSLNDLLQRARQNPGTARLKPATINRWITQLKTILDAAQMHGFGPFDVAALVKSRPKDTERVDEKRAAITDAMIEALLRHPTWINISSATSPAVYWTPLISLTTGARLGEILALTAEDVDFAARVIRIRRGKTAAAARRVPLHAELLRLGFMQFVKSKPSSSALLFSELNSKGQKSSVESIFSKKFKPMLHKMSPDAKLNGVTFHSIRSWFNSRLIECVGLNDAMRRYVLGHAPVDVNEKNYMKNISDSTVHDVGKMVPVFTNNLQKRVW